MKGSRLPSRERMLAVLGDVARRRETISYSGLAAILGLPRRGPHWKALLDDLALNRPAGWPDLSLLVVSATTRLPRQHRMMPLDQKDKAGVERVRAAQNEVWRSFAEAETSSGDSSHAIWFLVCSPTSGWFRHR